MVLSQTSLFVSFFLKYDFNSSRMSVNTVVLWKDEKKLIKTGFFKVRCSFMCWPHGLIRSHTIKSFFKYFRTKKKTSLLKFSYARRNCINM